MALFGWLKGPPREIVDIHRRMLGLFRYKDQKDGDELRLPSGMMRYRAWESHYTKGLEIVGDCDDYAMTAYAVWHRLFPNNPEGYLRYVRIHRTRQMHVTFEVPGSDGRIWVLDNRKPQPYLLRDERALGYDFEGRTLALIAYINAEKL